MRALVLLSLILAPRPAPAQTALPPDPLADVEAAPLDTPAEADGEAYAESLAALRAAPLDVNTADAPDLAALPGFDLDLAARLVAHRRTHGPYRSLAELRGVAGLTDAHLAAARPYLTVARPAPGVRVAFAHRIARRVEPSRAYTEARYAGGPARLTTRLRITRGSVRAALTLDKDPGEALGWAPTDRRFAYDHAAGHVALERGGRGRLVAGDFTVAAGQGLLLGRAGPGAASDLVDAPVRAGGGAAAYAGAGEHAYFRGGAATLQAGAVRLTVFASRRRLDAAPDGPASLTTTGLHRTEGERARRRTLSARTLGALATWTRGGLHGGVAAYTARFGRPLVSDAPPPTQAHRKRVGVSAYGHLAAGSALVFGEAAWTGAAWGGVGGLRLRLPAGALVVAGRALPAALDAPYGAPFGRTSDAPRNEHGLYLALALPLGPAWHADAAVDTYRAPWLRDGVDRPTAGRATRLVVRYAPRRWAELSATLRHDARENGAKATAAHRRLAAVAVDRRTAARVQAAYAFSPRLSLRIRLEGTRATAEGADPVHGVALLHDVRLHPHRRLRLDARLALFDVGDYAARIYTYEHDVRYAFSVPALSDVGLRRYLLATLTLPRGLVLEVRIAGTRLAHARTVGSGLDEVDGPRRREVGVQLRWQR